MASRVPLIDRIRKPTANLSRLSICIYGRGGSGKTTLLSTMPGKGLVIDIPQIEGGTSVLAGLKDDLDVLPVVRWAGEDSLDEAIKFLRGSDHDYRWVAVDTITACQELARRKAVSDRDLEQDPYLLNQQDWGKLGTLMAELFYRVRLLRMNTILLAQEGTRKNEGNTEYIPEVSPFSFRHLTPPQHLIARLYTHQTHDKDGNVIWERRLRTGLHPAYYTKTRSDQTRKLPDVIKNPHLGRVLAYMLGKEVAPPEAADDEAIFEL